MPIFGWKHICTCIFIFWPMGLYLVPISVVTTLGVFVICKLRAKFREPPVCRFVDSSTLRKSEPLLHQISLAEIEFWFQSWSWELADIAQGYADGCLFEHNTARLQNQQDPLGNTTIVFSFRNFKFMSSFRE